MKNSIRLVTGAAILMLGASAAVAQQTTDYEYYVTGEGENRVVMSRSGGEGMRILPSQTGQRPGQCPNGTFYSRGDNSVASCDDDSAFSMMAPEAGMMMHDGQPFQEGAMIMAPDTMDAPETTGSTRAPGTTPSADQPRASDASDTGGISN